MKILLINNFYYNRGGDCTYLFSLKKLLEEKGHKTVVFSMHHPQNFDSEYSKYFVSYINYDEEVKNRDISSGLKVLRRTIYSREARMKIEKIIENEKPDIAHIQNIHHHITPSIFYAFKKHKIPIVWTLHDYTIICPNTSFLSHGRICEKCRKRRYFWPLLVRCKKESFGASLIAALEITLHRIFKFNNLVDNFITPSEFLRRKLLDYGFDGQRVTTLNNFICCADITEGKENGNYYLYIGRLSEEKGVKTLIDATIKAASNNINNPVKLKIVGDGPLKNEMISYAKTRNAEDKIEFLGYKKHPEVIELLKNCQFVVSPSEWYENFSYSILEAFASGKPVIGSRIGGIPEIIRNWETGLLFRSGNSDDLSLKIKFFIKHPDKAAEMGKNSRMFVERRLNAENYYQRLLEIYKNSFSKKI